ncbi:hypothetical protein CF15_02200 [Pyrodictium occultum]|uniref:Endonuclease V n=1 Tax=Pyrodictium occultum TaxID=2309 RepID=A0A0V8RUJ4_PYROC|nr:endonuclease V [Pyrodictium occultum]KSW11656.1 hypothetical protein CF15_02200 [Pyrodictium occultum]
MRNPYPSIERLMEIQYRIASRVWKTLQPLPRPPRRAVGLDAAYSRRYGGLAVAALVDTASGRLLDYSVALGEPALEYIPGLLAFREAPLFYTAVQHLREDFDLAIVDGHGISHPRRAGIATHVGLAIGKPTVGVAKKRLHGSEIRVQDPSSCSSHPCVLGYLVDDESRRMAYVVLPSRRTRNPIYVSPGAYIDLGSALQVVLSLLRGTKLPLPTHYADKISKRLARMLDEGAVSPRQLKKGLRRIEDFTGG